MALRKRCNERNYGALLKLLYFIQNARLETTGPSYASMASGRRARRILNLLHHTGLFEATVVFNFIKRKTPGAGPISIERDGLTVIEIPYVAFTAVALIHHLTIVLRRILAERSHVAVMSYNFNPGASLPSLLAKAIRPNAPYILQLEDGIDYDRSLSPLKKRIYRSLLAVQRWVATAALVPTPALSKYVMGIPTFTFTGLPTNPQLAKANGGSGERRRRKILFAGTLDKRRGIYDYLDSIAAGNLSAYEHHICGFVSDPARFDAALTAARSRAEVIFHGALDSDKYADLLAQVDVVLSLADPDDGHTRETFPSKVIDAVEAGKVVVSYRLAGFERAAYPTLFVTDRHNLPQTIRDLDFDAIATDIDRNNLNWLDESAQFIEFLRKLVKLRGTA